MKKELNVLAVECRKAFEVARLVDSIQPQIRKAVDLCSSYSPTISKLINREAASRTLWKENKREHQMAMDKKELATSVLGWLKRIVNLQM